MLAGQNFGGSEHRHLIAILDGNHSGFRRDDGFAAAHVALQQPVHGARRRHILRDLAQHTLLRAGGFEGQHGFDALAHAIVQLEGDTGREARLVPLQGQPAFEPEELFEDEAEMGRRAEAVQETQVRALAREMRVADRCPAVGQAQPFADTGW